MSKFVNTTTKPVSKQQAAAATNIILRASQEKINSRKQLLELQKAACSKFKINMISNPILLETYKQLVADEKIKANPQLFQLLRKRRIRTSSGIASVAVLTKPYECPGKCVFCPTQVDVPKSYIDNEPAVMRAILADYDPIKQINIRLRGFEVAGNPAEKIELIVMGGTFSYLPREYQLKFIIGCFGACNDYGKKFSIFNFQFSMNDKISNDQLMKILKKEQKKNETAKHKIIGLTLETRPDYINQDELKWFRTLGCTRVEIGIQSIYDDVLKANNRGHLVDKTIEATKLLKDAGFKICYHLMPNLYTSSYERDIKMFEQIFSDERFQPDMIKIYPCVVTKYAELEKLYRAGKYIPYTDEELTKLLIEIKNNLPEYVRVQRLIRDIPKQNIIAGSTVSNLRQVVHEQGVKCNCIRCREIRESVKLPVKLKRIDYTASDGQEIFLQYVDEHNKLYAMLRLRIPSQSSKNRKHWMEDLTDCAIIRELHTYGQVVPVGEKHLKDPQHSGLGKKLIAQAEQIAANEFGLKKIAVISGVGVRNYYRKFDYQLKDTYLVKELVK